MELKGWRLAYGINSKVKDMELTTPDEILASGLDIIDAAVPGNFELDLARAGKFPADFYVGANLLESQKLEAHHLWYFTGFETTEADTDIVFEGIDTFADIYIDGEYFAGTSNMLVPYEWELDDIPVGSHTLVVHILPTLIEARGFATQAIGHGNRADAHKVRKAPYMFGWDIMPRTVSAGIWRPVKILSKKSTRIDDIGYRVIKRKEDRIDVEFYADIVTDADFMHDFTVTVEGSCNGSHFRLEKRLYSSSYAQVVKLYDPVLWWPKNYGDPNMYDITATLYFKGEMVDEKTFKAGFRTVELERTDEAGEDGKFGFIINGKRVFVMGTNWVPTDAFPSRHDEYTLRGLELADDIGCNMIRCWGGNVYPSDMLYDYCDAHGIMVWQDFTMACGKYPRTLAFASKLRFEAIDVVKRLRNHPSLVLWAGDNECDSAVRFHPEFGGEGPEDNFLTRDVLKRVVQTEDGYRPFLPSSPYVKQKYGSYDSAEDHLWGPRDYFKGDYYKNANCHFASETGYHGCPAPESLKKFITPEHYNNIGDSKECHDVEWLLHGTAYEPVFGAKDTYRNPLMVSQVERLFGEQPSDMSLFALESQISQAEAMKYFIERFRIQKWYTTGIIWWNIIDGWPQVSDAVVDWYGTKKLAYHYIKTSQTPFCIMCDEPDQNGDITAVAANDTRDDVSVTYTVTDLKTNEVVARDTVTVASDSTLRLASFKENATYYRIDWSGDISGSNHFTGRIGDKITLDSYNTLMQSMGYNQKLEGF